MKYIYSIFICILFSISLYGQCECQKINRDDGATVTQCNPKPIASDKTTQIGIAAASNSQEYFITVVVRFKNKSKKIAGNLSIRLDDNNLISLTLVKSELAYIGNSEVSQAVFHLSATKIQKFKNSSIKTISIKLNNVHYTYNCDLNTSVLINQLNCM